MPRLDKIRGRVIVFERERYREASERWGRERNICQREDTENKLTDAQFKPCRHSNYSKLDLFSRGKPLSPEAIHYHSSGISVY